MKLYHLGYLNIKLLNLGDLEMKLKEILEVLHEIENDITIEKQEFINKDNHYSLPLFIKDLVYHLEELLMINRDYFLHIIQNLNRNNYQVNHIKDTFQECYYIKTSKGILIIT